MVILLDEEDVNRVIDMKRAIDVIEESFRLLGLGKIEMPTRVHVKYPNTFGILRIMASSIDGIGALGSKMLLGYPPKRKPGLTYFVAMVFDPLDGHLLSIMGANRLTQLRTGAASAVATKYLARQDASIVGLFGSGVQARGQLEGLAEVRKVKEVRVYDIDKEKRDKFCKEQGHKLGIDVKGVEEPEFAVKGCDIIVTATTSRSPLFGGDVLDEGVHINAIGSNNPAKREVDVKTLMRSKIVVDHKGQALKEAGDLIIPIREGLLDPDVIYAELSDIVLGRKKGREDDKEITLFKSVGIASEDVALAYAIYQEAVKQGLGKEIRI
jgi:alanine dehydrogenase